MLAASGARSHLCTAFSPVIPNRVHVLGTRFAAGKKIPERNKQNQRGQVNQIFLFFMNQIKAKS